MAPAPAAGPQDRNFRFFDNRQKYLLFVSTCSEKAVVAQRVKMELANIHPRPPAVRIFDAGVGDGTVLTRVMRAMHSRFATMPFYIVGKEISLEDVRLTLEKMPDRFFEHPATVLVMTNLYYREAPWLVPSIAHRGVRPRRGTSSPLTGTTGARVRASRSPRSRRSSRRHWRAHVSPTSGNPVYERPAVLVIYREDHRFLLDPIIPRRGGTAADYDLVIASQPYRARAPLDFKASARDRAAGEEPRPRRAPPRDPFARQRPGTRDPAGDVAGENPFQHDRHQMLKAVKDALGPAARDLNFNAYSDARSLFRFDMHTLPTEISSSIGTSTLFAAWNAAIYVGQIEDARLEDAIRHSRYLQVTAEVLQARRAVVPGRVLRHLAAARLKGCAT